MTLSTRVLISGLLCCAQYPVDVHLEMSEAGNGGRCVLSLRGLLHGQCDWTGSVASKMHGGIARPLHSAADALGRSPVLSAIREHRHRLGP